MPVTAGSVHSMTRHWHSLSHVIISMEQEQKFKIQIANASHQDFAQIICDEMESSAKARGTGIAKRSPDYIKEKMREGKAVIAFTEDGIWAGFCYIETWSHGEYVANSGLIVAPPFRKSGLAKKIKKKIFELSRKYISECQNIRSHHRPGRNEDQFRPGL